MTMEFVALANHRKIIRAEIARYAEQFRARQIEAIATVLASAEIDVDRELLSPAVVSVLMTSLSRVLVMEKSLGMSAGHAETEALVERWLDKLEHAGDQSFARPGTPSARGAST